MSVVWRADLLKAARNHSLCEYVRGRQLTSPAAQQAKKLRRISCVAPSLLLVGMIASVDSGGCDGATV